MEFNTEKIKRELKRLGWSYADLGRAMGRHRQWVAFKLNDSGGSHLSTIEEFAKALDLNPRDLIK